MFDYTVDEFWTMANYCFLASMGGVLLAVLLYLAVVYIPV